MQKRSSRPADALSGLQGMARTTDLVAAGVHPRDLYAARASGEVVEVARGLFCLPERAPTEPDLAVVAARMPKAILSTVTALALDGLTQEIPRAVHITLPRGVRPAKVPFPLEVYHVSPEFLERGVDVRVIDGRPMRVTSPARSVADFFRFRSRLGIEAAVDALKQVLAAGAATASEVDQMAVVCRVQSVIRPYLEALA